MKEIIIKVKGMSCGGCEKRIENAVKTIKGVKEVKADHQKAIAQISCKEEVSEKEIKEKIEDIGFTVED